MFDFDNLSDQQKALLQIKLDGFVEAAVQAARVHGIGISEALSLAILAFLREISAHGFSLALANRMWADATEKAYPGTRELAWRNLN